LPGLEEWRAFEDFLVRVLVLAPVSRRRRGAARLTAILAGIPPASLPSVPPADPWALLSRTLESPGAALRLLIGRLGRR
jgi:hypothetical protein